MSMTLQIAEAIRRAYNQEVEVTAVDLEDFCRRFPDLEGELLIQRAAAYFWGRWLIRGLGKEKHPE
jgi:hypothetical protein